MKRIEVSHASMKATINGIEIDYRDEGAGVPVVFIHAFPLNQSMWDEQVSQLREHCRTITLDLRGFGRSEAPQDPFSIDEMAADVRGLMSILNIDRAVLVGLSMGGYVTLAFYRSYPDAVRAMVLADTRASADTSDARERRLKSAQKAEAEGSAAIANDMIPLLLGDTTLNTRPGTVDRVRSMIEANAPRVIAGAQRAMADRRDSTDALPNIEIPVMIIFGAEDKLTSAGEAESLRTNIKEARLGLIEAAGHLPNIERPAEFNALLTEFISSL